MDFHQVALGSGLVLEEWHILTNQHVVEGVNIKAGDEPETPRTPGPPVAVTPWHTASETVRVARAVPHAELDVAVIELEQVEGARGLNALDARGVFGNPRSLR